MPKGKRGPRPDDKKATRKKEPKKPNGEARQEASVKEQMFKCDDCIAVLAMPEMMEHLSAVGHTGYEAAGAIDIDNAARTERIEKEEQTPLFNEPGPIYRSLEVPFSEEEMIGLWRQAADIAVKLREQKQILGTAKDNIKILDVEQMKVAASIAYAKRSAQVECEWQVDFESNSKRLLRKDTGVELDKVALSAEDRAAELARIEAQNKTPEQSAGATA